VARLGQLYDPRLPAINTAALTSPRISASASAAAPGPPSASLRATIAPPDLPLMTSWVRPRSNSGRAAPYLEISTGTSATEHEANSHRLTSQPIVLSKWDELANDDLVTHELLAIH
jgi:hypothetical protein